MRIFYLALFLLYSSFLFSQINDCDIAQIVCNNENIAFNPIGAGLNDFANPNNNSGCLTTGENSSAWFYFEIEGTAPPNQTIEFSIMPTGGNNQDYDFAVFGPNVPCSDLGNPIRCSYAGPGCGFCPNTGLGNGATDNSEGANGDGFVAPITVQPGDGFFILVDNFSNNGIGFNLAWSGSAADDLNCNAELPCDLTADAGLGPTACEGDSGITLNGSATGTQGSETYSWVGTNGSTSYLDDPTSPNPNLTIPLGASGTFDFTLTVTESDCVDDASVTLTVNPLPAVSLNGPPSICEDDQVISLTSSPFGGTWSPNAPNGQFNPSSAGTGPQTVEYTVTNQNGCSNTASTVIMVNPAPTVNILPFNTNLCTADNPVFLDANPPGGTWTGDVNNGVIFPNLLGIGGYSVTYSFTNAEGCSDMTTIDFFVFPNPDVTIQDPGVLCENGNPVTLSADPPGGTWGGNGTGGVFNPSNFPPGIYPVTYTAGEFNCNTEETINIEVAPAPFVLMDPIPALCTSSDNFTISVNPPGGTWGSSTPGGIIDPGALGAGNYIAFYTYTDPQGCEVVSPQSFSIDAPPAVSIANVGDLCATGNPQILSATPIGGTWSSNATGGIFDPSAVGSGSYVVTYTYTDPNSGCEGSEDLSIQVNAAPTVNIIGNNSICQNSSTILATDVSFNSYSWSTGETSSAISVSNQNTYSVTVTDSGGCTATNQFNVTITPELEPTVSGTLAVCNGLNTTLTVDGTYSNYQWSNTQNTNLISVGVGTYTVTVTDASGCTGSEVVNVTSNGAPTPTIDGNTSFCDGDNTILSTQSFSNYEWSDGSSSPFITVTNQGTYTVTVTDGNGCTGTIDQFITENVAETPVFDGNTSFCLGGTTNLTLSNSFNSYSWSTGETSPFIIVSSNGIVSVTVTDANGCESENSIMITENPLPAPDILGNTSFCNNSNTTLSLDPSFNNYTWSTGISNSPITVTQDGVFSVTVTDANGCTGEDQVTVSVTPELEPTISGALSVCDGLNTTLTVDGTYTNYEWSNTQNTNSISVGIGTYTVTVTDASGCTGSEVVNILANTSPTPTIEGITSFCAGENTVLNTQSFDSYEWSDGSFNSTITVTSQGTYTVTVTDGNGCTGSFEQMVTENLVEIPQFDGNDSFCEGASTNLSISNSFNTYSWSTGESTPTIDVSQNGMIGVTVTDANGCESENSIMITQNTLPVPDILGGTNICANSSTILDASNANYTDYAWSNGNTSSSILVDEAGTFTVTVTDLNGCLGTNQASVQVTAELEPTLSGDFEFCNGETGLIEAEAGFDMYEWSDLSSGQSIAPTATGTYTVTVTDASGCTGSAEMNVTEFDIPDPQISGSTSFCTGNFTTLDVPGNWSSFNWSENSTTSSISVSTAGTYTVTVTDSEGCEGITSIDIVESTSLNPVIVGDLGYCPNGTTVLDAGLGFDSYTWSNGETSQIINVGSTGDVTVTVSDASGCMGTATVSVTENNTPTPVISGQSSFCIGSTATIDAGDNYSSYLWSNGETTQTLSVNETGTYSVTVTDANGCEGENFFDVQELASLDPEIQGPTALCEGTSITIAAAANFETYTWSDGVTTTENIEVTQAGNYTVTVTDVNGCEGEETYIISENLNPQPEILGDEDICPNSSTTLSPDVSYISYEWSNGLTDENITIDVIGTYTLTVTDANGCIGTDEIIVNELQAPSTTISGIPSFCPNENTMLDAGSNFVNYIWSSSQTDQVITVDQAGTYTVTITDANGCTGLESIIVEENIPPSPIIDGASSFCSDNSTTLDATGNFTSYTWSDSSTEPVLVVDESGTYGVTVTDNNGCIGTSEITVTETTSLLPSFTGTPNFCPTETTIIQAETGFNTYEWSDGTMDASISISTAGTYTVTVTDVNGCEGTNTIDISQNIPPTPNVLGSATFCVGFSSTLSVDGIYDQYQWSDNSSNPTLEVDVDGIYFVTVTDANGCTGVSSLQVNESAELQPSIQAPPSFCTGTTATLDAGVGFETYIWSDNVTTGQTLEVSSPGTYSVTVTDLSGCEGETSFVITEDTPVDAGIANAPDAYCSVDVTLIDLQNELTGADTNGQWTETSNNPSTGSGFNATTGEFNTAAQLPGTYTFDYFIPANGACVSDVETVSVIIEETPVASIDPAIVLNCNNPTTELNASNSTGGNTLTYTWSTGDGSILSGGDTPNPMINADGIYDLTIALPNGCVATSSITINEDFEAPDADAGSIQQLTCIDGQAVLNGNSSIPGAIYTWSGPGIVSTNMNDQNPTVTVSGTYTLTTTNPNNGCESALSSVMVEDNLDAPVFSIDPVGLLSCDVTSQVLTGPLSANFTYQWLLDGNPIAGANNEAYEATQPGIYSLQITDINNGCNSISVVEVLESVDPPFAEAGTAELITCDASIITLNGGGSSSGNDFTYEWLDINNNTIPNSNSLTIDISQPGNYTLVVTNTMNGCTSTDMVTVEADTNFPIADAGTNATLDCDFNSISLGGNSSTGNDINYLWTTTNGGNITNPTSLNASISTPGTYQLQVIDTSNDCISIDEVIVLENTNIPEEVEYDLMPISCNGENDGAFSVIDVVGGTGPYQYAFDGSNFSDVSSFPFLSPGEYSLIVEDALGCQLQTQISLIEPSPFILDLGDDQTIELGQDAQILAQTSSPIDSIKWQLDASLPCTDCLDPRVAPLITTTYQATAVDFNGCVDSDDITIFVEKNRRVFIPNVFTPNDDGVNDLFNVFGGDDVEKIHVLKVYNRWGEVVYEHTDFLPNDISVGWDGFFKGKKMNPAVFVYYAEIEFKDGFKTIYKGDVALRK